MVLKIMRKNRILNENINNISEVFLVNFVDISESLSGSILNLFHPTTHNTLYILGGLCYYNIYAYKINRDNVR